MTNIYDLVHRQKEKILVAANFFIGSGISYYDKFSTLLLDTRPEHVILINTFDLSYRQLSIEHLRRFSRILEELGTDVRVACGCAEGGYTEPLGGQAIFKNVKRNLRRQIDRLLDEPPDNFQIDEPHKRHLILGLYQLYRFPKETISVRLANGEVLAVVTGEQLHTSYRNELSAHDLLLTLEGYRAQLRADWLITGHPGIAHIDQETKIVCPGSWCAPDRHEDFRGCIKREHLAKAILINERCELSVQGLPL